MGMKVRISSAALQQITSEATASPHAEICGLLFGSGDLIEHAEPCTNVASDPSNAFEIDPSRLIAAHRAMRRGGPTLAGCYHSHPFGPPSPSPRDAAAASPDGWWWVIAAVSGIGIYRAAAGGSLHGMFEPLAYDIVPPGCAERAPSPERAAVEHVRGEFSR
jgi:proteasome lid subunit RPN8/RPN11